MCNLKNIYVQLIASYPQFPHGTCDPVQELGEIAYNYDIGLHVDCCLGGFVVAFLKDEVKKFGFSVRGKFF